MSDLLTPPLKILQWLRRTYLNWVGWGGWGQELWIYFPGFWNSKYSGSWPLHWHHFLLVFPFSATLAFFGPLEYAKFISSIVILHYLTLCLKCVPTTPPILHTPPVCIPVPLELSDLSFGVMSLDHTIQRESIQLFV